MNEFSEAEFDRLLEQAEQWQDEFSQSKECKKLTKVQKENSTLITPLISDFMYSYYLATPSEWKGRELSEILVSIFPRKLAVSADFYQHVGPVLISYFDFLADNKKIKNKDELIESVKNSVELMAEQADDSDNWSFGKQIAVDAEELGFDLTNEADIQHFIDMQNKKNGF